MQEMVDINTESKVVIIAQSEGKDPLDAAFGKGARDEMSRGERRARHLHDHPHLRLAEDVEADEENGPEGNDDEDNNS